MKPALIVASLLAETLGASLFAAPQKAQYADVEQQLAAQYRLTTVGRGGQIAATGSVLVVQKNGLQMYTIANPMPPQSTYKNGKISRGAFAGFGKDLVNVMHIPGPSAAIDQRIVAAGEKVWVSKIDIQKDGVVFRMYDGGGYYGDLKFPFAKNTVPPADQLLSNIAEALAVQPDDKPPAPTADTAATAPTADTAATTASPETAVTTPAPPPEQPAAPPPTVSLGLTIDQVVAMLGQPDRVADLGSKKIYSYKDMKITFINGKVSDIE